MEIFHNVLILKNMYRKTSKLICKYQKECDYITL